MRSLLSVISVLGLRLIPSSKGAIVPGLDEGVLTMCLGELAEIKVGSFGVDYDSLRP